MGHASQTITLLVVRDLDRLFIVDPVREISDRIDVFGISPVHAAIRRMGQRGRGSTARWEHTLVEMTRNYMDFSAVSGRRKGNLSQLGRPIRFGS